MKACRLCLRLLPISEYYADYHRHDGRMTACKLCTKLARREYAARNKAVIQRRNKRYYERNKDKLAVYQHTWRTRNADKLKKQREAKRATAEYKARFSSYVAARKAKQKTECTPEERAAMLRLYRYARALSRVTGTRYVVDHIVPIAKGGVHHPSNLRVCTAEENSAKYASTVWNVRPWLQRELRLVLSNTDHKLVAFRVEEIHRLLSTCI